jgi:DNA-binding CsgD family transcriptional regulator
MENKVIELQKEIQILKEKLRFTEEILDKAPCFLYINEIGIIGQENTMRNVYMNKFASEMTGYSKEEADKLGHEFFRQVLHPDDFEVINQSIEFLRSIQDDNLYGGICRSKPKGKDYIWQVGRTRVFKRKPDGTALQFLNAAVILHGEIHSQNQMIDLLKENKRLINENIILRLSKREREVLKHLSAGDCAKKISGKLNISESTVVSHRKNMLRKLNMHSTANLVNFAVENGLN